MNRTDPAPPTGGSADANSKHIFVTGASRSGTTLLARMLGAHGTVATFQELHYFGDLCEVDYARTPMSDVRLRTLAGMLIARQERGLWCGRATPAETERATRIVETLSGAQRNAADLLDHVMRAMAGGMGKHSACEQTPRNIFYAERLLDLYPRARVVHLVRDPRAVLASQKNRWRLRRLGAAHLPRMEMLRTRANYHPYTMSRLWVRATAEAVRLTEHPRFLITHFEDIASDPERTTRRICDFLELSFEPAMLAQPRWGSSNLRHTTDGTGVSAEVVDTWRCVLSRGETTVCERIAGSLMDRFDYPREIVSTGNRLVMLPSVLAYPFHAAAVVALNPGRALTQLRAIATLHH